MVIGSEPTIEAAKEAILKITSDNHSGGGGGGRRGQRRDRNDRDRDRD